MAELGARRPPDDLREACHASLSLRGGAALGTQAAKFFPKSVILGCSHKRSPEIKDVKSMHPSLSSL